MVQLIIQGMHLDRESVFCASLHLKNICGMVRSGKSKIALGKHQSYG